MFNIPKSRHQSTIGARLAYREMANSDWPWPDEWLYQLATEMELVRYHRNEVFLTLMQMTDEWAQRVWRRA